MANVSRKISLLTLAFLCFYLQDASALTIVTRFIGGEAPANAVGRGNLEEIVRTASRIWESAYSDPILITLNYGWGQSVDAGVHTLQSADETGREIAGTIIFDNSGAVSFYLDPTPESNEEYRRRTEEYQDLGGGFINVARVFGSAAGEAAGHVDLLSVVLHEIGHALGLSGANPRFLTAGSNGLIIVPETYPFSGTAIPLAYNNSGIVAHFDANEVVYGSLMSGVNGDERRMPSDLDILADGLVSGFTMPAAMGSAAQATTSASQVSVGFRTPPQGNESGTPERR